MLGEVARIVVTIDWAEKGDGGTDDRLLSLLQESRDALADEMAVAFEPLRGALLPGELELEPGGSVRMVLHVLGEIALWTATAAGVWQMLEYARNEVVRRVRRVLRRRFGHSVYVVAAGVIPVMPLPAVATRPTSATWGQSNAVLRYLIVSHAVLLVAVVGVLIALLVHVL